ncbi:MAG: S41 family peptidase, partial [Bacteroidia bacterium]|nr:S41 family peptidase [Bacteroidia bacterium]
MLKSLDPYTNYISASEIEDFRFMSTGQYGGIGAIISKRNQKIIVAEPYEGSPAVQAGLKAGDEIIKIDNEQIEGKNFDTQDIRNLLKGQPKTQVKLVIRRPNVPDLINLTITRDEIKVKNVPYFTLIDGDIGYVHLTGFTKDAANEVKQALISLKNQNPNLTGIILDVRDNPGGLLMEAVSISNLFVSKGSKIVETKGRIEGADRVYEATASAYDEQTPLVVLINDKSASASEIVAGVIQDLDRGIIIGQKSFGKGLVQNTRPLSYNTQLKITTSKYYTPSGRCIQAIDYSHRKEDGSVVKIADSLKKEFKTKAGRSVYDGGGISPDIKVPEREYHKITQELVSQQIIFDFATDFAHKNPKIASTREFKITDQIYNQFIEFVASKSFKYETQTEKEISHLKE